MENRRGQIAIFVIVAVLLVGAILFIFLIGRKPNVERDGGENPESFIDNCIKKKAENVLDAMMNQGGFVAPTDFMLYQNNRITYLCKNVNYYEPCIAQYPRYIIKLQDELNEQVQNDVEQCFSELENQLEKRNYDVSGGPVFVSSVFKEGVVEINTNHKLSISKGDTSRTFSEFNTIILYPAYNLAYVANEILDQEARNCYFSTEGFMALYPDYDIRKDFAYDGQTEIYSITDKDTNKKIVFAVRGCVIPAGF